MYPVYSALSHLFIDVVKILSLSMKYNHDYLTSWWDSLQELNTLTPRQNGRHFTDDTFKRILLNENVRTSIKISLKFVPKGPINNIVALVQIMAWRRSGDKPLSESMMVSLLTHIYASLGLNELTVWPVWIEVTCHIGNKTKKASLSIARQLKFWLNMVFIWWHFHKKIRMIPISETRFNTCIFSCDQAALRKLISAYLSVRVSHLFDNVPVIVSPWTFQELLPLTDTMSMQEVKVRGQRSRSQRSWLHLTVFGR